MSTRIGPDIDAVTTLLEGVGQELVVPRFQGLRAEEIERKWSASDPDDLVTIVDREVEERLTSALPRLGPPARVVGEEAVHARPELLELLQSDDPVWVLDPIDGTKNFARGQENFAIMLAWVVSGQTRAAWLYLPARRQMFVAEAGSGACLNRVRVQVHPRLDGEPLRGTILTRYMPAALVESTTRSSCGRYVDAPAAGCAAVDYTDVLHGRNHFIVYHRLLPWDHAAPALVLTEAGGRVEHIDGTPYSVRSVSQPTAVGRDPVVSNEVRSWFRPDASA